MAGSLENRGKLRELIDKFQFADIFGVSRQAVSKWESDNGYPETQKILPLQQSGINNIIYILLLNMEYLYG